jgi:hypothetical protein
MKACPEPPLLRKEKWFWLSWISSLLSLFVGLELQMGLRTTSLEVAHSLYGCEPQISPDKCTYFLISRLSVRPNTRHSRSPCWKSK